MNQNNFTRGLRQMLYDASSYYLLGYNSSLEATDGEFHEIDVRVRREGVRVRSRPGYWAITERDAVRAPDAAGQRAAARGRCRPLRAGGAAPRPAGPDLGRNGACRRTAGRA